jgi:hypothetical protein
VLAPGVLDRPVEDRADASAHGLETVLVLDVGVRPTGGAGGRRRHRGILPHGALVGRHRRIRWRRSRLGSDPGCDRRFVDDLGAVIVDKSTINSGHAARMPMIID